MITKKFKSISLKYQWPLFMIIDWLILIREAPVWNVLFLIGNAQGGEGGGVKALQNGLENFIPTFFPGCKGLPGCFGELYSHLFPGV